MFLNIFKILGCFAFLFFQKIIYFYIFFCYLVVLFLFNLILCITV